MNLAELHEWLGDCPGERPVVFLVDGKRTPWEVVARTPAGLAAGSVAILAKHLRETIRKQLEQDPACCSAEVELAGRLIIDAVDDGAQLVLVPRDHDDRKRVALGKLRMH